MNAITSYFSKFLITSVQSLHRITSFCRTTTFVDHHLKATFVYVKFGKIIV